MVTLEDKLLWHIYRQNVFETEKGNVVLENCIYMMQKVRNIHHNPTEIMKRWL